MGIKLITDSACDLPIEYIRENNIDFASLSVNIKGKFVIDDLGQTLKYNDFYKLLREGEMPSTSQVNVGTFEDIFTKYVEKGESIIYIGLSSTLSGTFNSASIAREIVLEKNPKADISVIDSLSVSLGEGALVYYACEMIKNGSSKEEVVRWVEDNKRKVVHAITIDDLSHLKRGGRISSATAAVGGLLNIKPTLKIDAEGNVIPGVKIKGKKKVIKYLVDQVKENAVNIEKQVLFICHSDCLSEAELLKEVILSEVKPKDVIINSIGAVIGTHGGPGILAVAFMANERY